MAEETGAQKVHVDLRPWVGILLHLFKRRNRNANIIGYKMLS
jgi:hypothetical protein